jgi:hypothetical protein
MTPERKAEIQKYIDRLDLDQLPGWTVGDRIISDLWEELKAAEAKIAAAAMEPHIAEWFAGQLTWDHYQNWTSEEFAAHLVRDAFGDQPAQVGEESGGDADLGGFDPWYLPGEDGGDAERQDLAQLGDDLELKDGR